MHNCELEDFKDYGKISLLASILIKLEILTTG